jgi:hypothetical protein
MRLDWVDLGMSRSLESCRSGHIAAVVVLEILDVSTTRMDRAEVAGRHPTCSYWG